MSKELKIVFAPGCFDGFDGTQEELDKLAAEIKKMAEQGTLEEQFSPLSEEEEEEILRLMKQRKARQ